MKRLAVILTEGFADWEYGFLAGTAAPFYGLELRFFTPKAGIVRSQGGLKANVDLGLDEMRAWSADMVVIIGGMIWETAEAPDLGDTLRAQLAGGGWVAGICGGTLALARAGALDAVRHTSNAAPFLQQVENYGGQALYQEGGAAISDGHVITAPGTAPVSFTAAIFEAVGVVPDQVSGFRTMLAAEHLA
ncbi:DJ-1/PfpI family protein [Gymnodinialimonas sp. 2305UL16-5]|uniref:DJ-1/PfpI family protein n=1 Tax=Gymnodinialimonas mytili TaxID=3126503 RepID=UPI0030963688